MSDRADSTATASHPVQRELLPMDPQLKNIQPGGGVIMQIEQVWGVVRRVWLKTFRRNYLRCMNARRQGEYNPCPHELLDPRDLKFYQNQGGYYWDPADDPFTWRDKLPFARDGLAELFLLGGFSLALALGSSWWAVTSTGVARVLAALLALAAAIVGLLIVWFFRNPKRPIPTESGSVVSPADGKVVDIEELEYDDFVQGPAVKIGIFLSIFNVHINRSPMAGRVIGVKYQPGKCLNALRPESARENEQLAVLLESSEPPYHGMIVRQITGAIARRIVCRVRPGDALQRGETFGMIKFGSRTELVLPRQGNLTIQTKLGDKVKAGTSVLARYT